MHVYAYGSICRGEIDYGSDIDLLAIVDLSASDLDPSKFSIYSHTQIRQLWNDGNPFAWHLATESKLLFSPDGVDFLKALEEPNEYKQVARDCNKFQRLFGRARTTLEAGSSSPVFELSTMFLAVRNFATCYALGCRSECEFSRSSARRLGDKSLVISDDTFSVLVRSRLLSTRGSGAMVGQDDVAVVLQEANSVSAWMSELMKEV